MDKNSIRADFLKKREKLSKKLVKEKSDQIFQNFLKIPEILDKSSFLIYLPVRNEVETALIVKLLQSEKKKILLPAFLKESKEYIFSTYQKGVELEAGPYGILQPAGQSAISLEQVDAAIVPGVVFDKAGNRLGYGKGVYDKLLSGFDGLIIGLAYDFQLVNKLPRQDHDLKLDIIITEVELHSTK